VIALVTGLGAVGLYLAGVAVSGHLSVLARRPLLDGAVPLPPYRWVSPPRELSAAHRNPKSGRFVLGLDPKGLTRAKVLSTPDFQANVALPGGAIRAAKGSTSVVLRIAPLAPASGASVPSGIQIADNVYRIDAAAQPGGATAGRLLRPAQLVLFYPAVANVALYDHTLLRSDNGRTWAKVSSVDLLAQQVVQGTVREFGYFAVGQSRVAGRTNPGTAPTGSSGLPTILIAVLAVALIAIGVIAWLRRRRSSGGPKPPRPERRPPPRRSRRVDPWGD
jgi:hypothetical protein